MRAMLSPRGTPLGRGSQAYEVACRTVKRFCVEGRWRHVYGEPGDWLCSGQASTNACVEYWFVPGEKFDRRGRSLWSDLEPLGDRSGVPAGPLYPYPTKRGGARYQIDLRVVHVLSAATLRPARFWACVYRGGRLVASAADHCPRRAVRLARYEAMHAVRYCP